MSVTCKEPKLRFKEFSGEWEVNKLGELCFNISSGKTKALENGKFNVYGSTGIIGKTDVSTHNGNYILVARVGANAGLINYVDGQFAVTDNTLIIDLDKDKVVPQFLMPLLYKFNLNRLIFGSGQPLITGGQLKSLKLNLPKKPEQQKIASFLSAVDSRIEQLTKKEQLLREYKKGAMQKIFSGEIRFKDDDGSAFPEWEKKKLGDFLIHKSIKNKGKKVNLVLSVSNKKGFISQEEQFDGYEVASKDLSNYKIVNKGDYAYNPSRINVGSIARLDSFDKGIVSPMYVVFSLNNLDSNFFNALYNTHLFKHLIKIGCSGSVRDSLNFNDMAEFKINLPSLKEQTKIANFLLAIDKKIELVQKQLDTTKEFKKGLLQQMFI